MEQVLSVQHSKITVPDSPFTVMGVVNCTPDSFYDGGNYLKPDSAVEKALEFVDAGASVIDIGGESTRPGAKAVELQEELDRVLPVISGLHARSDVIISIDTPKSRVAFEALKAGAGWINDVSAGRHDENIADVAAACKCPVVLMHSRKTPADMQNAPFYGNAVMEVREELVKRADFFISRGVLSENIILDPGIGFAKRLEDNLSLILKIDELQAAGYPVLLGASRKSFIGAVTGRTVKHRLAGSLAAVGAAYSRGVRIFRVHDVMETVDFLKVLHAINHA